MQRKREYADRNRAFTLIEMLLVIVIIGILAGMIATSLSGRSQEARVTRAWADIRSNLSLALDLFEQDTGRYPTNEEGLSALVADPGVAGWRGPYLKGGLQKDPWGHDYVYARDTESSNHYVLSSAGPDGQAGSADDIVEQSTGTQ
jgi:general secretion pathway protein G